MDGVTVEDDPTAATHGTLSIQSAANTSIGKAVITGFQPEPGGGNLVFRATS